MKRKIWIFLAIIGCFVLLSACDLANKMHLKRGGSSPRVNDPGCCCFESHFDYDGKRR